MKISLWAGAAALGCLLLPPDGRAEPVTEANPAVAPASEPLEEIIVTASRVPERLQDVPASVSVVSAEEIRDTPAQELDDVLRAVPGVNLLSYSAESQHPTSDSISMRGLGGPAQGISRALVMVDGVPLNDPFFGFIQWGRVPLENIDRVEVVRGGGSPLWGNYAEGGVINIITNEPAEEKVDLDAGGGSYGTYRGSAYGAYFPSDTTKLQGFAAIDGTGGYQQVPAYERAPFNVPTGYQAINLQVKDSYTPSDDLSAHLVLDYHQNNQNLETRLDTNSQQILNLAADLRKQLGGGALTATLTHSDSSFATNNSTYFPIADDLAATTDSLNEIHHVSSTDTAGSLIWSQDFGGLVRSTMVGADLHYISGSNATDHYIAPSFEPTFWFDETRGDQLFVGGFAKLSLAPLQRLVITGSARYQFLEDTDGFDGSLGGLGRIPTRDYYSFDPRVDLRYAISDNYALRGAYYQSFRAPNLGDLFYGYAAGGFVQVPSPLLRPEKLEGGEVGFDYTRPGLRAQLTLYRSEIGNYIVIEPTTNAVYSPNGWYVVQNENIASVQAQGFEAEVDWDLGGGFSTKLGYTFADSIVEANPADPASIGKQVVDAPRHTLAAGVSYGDTDGWRLATQARYVSRTDWASPDHTYPGYPGKLAADSSFILDLTGSYPISRNVEIYLQIQNLLDRRYVTTSYSAPSAQVIGTPFTAFSGIRASFD